MARNGLPGGLDEAAFARHLARLERTASDRRVDTALRAGHARDAVAGNVIPRHVYRLVCGHLIAVHGVPLPTATKEAWCTGHGDQGRERADTAIDHEPGNRLVVEWLTRDRL